MIRQATRADLPRILQIRDGAGEQPLSDPTALSDAAAARYIDEAAMLVWQEPGGTVTGFAAVDRRDGSLPGLLVAAGEAGKGIGRALLKAGCDALRDAGHRTASLRTAAGGGVEEHYRRDGWTGDGIDAAGRVILQKPL